MTQVDDAYPGRSSPPPRNAERRLTQRGRPIGRPLYVPARPSSRVDVEPRRLEHLPLGDAEGGQVGRPRAFVQTFGNELRVDAKARGS